MLCQRLLRVDVCLQLCHCQRRGTLRERHLVRMQTKFDAVSFMSINVCCGVLLHVARRGSVGGAVLFRGPQAVSTDPILQVYTGFQGDLGRCELMLAMFLFARILLPQVVS